MRSHVMLLVIASCSRPAPVTQTQPAADVAEVEAGALDLPASVPGFTGGPATIADTYTRRTYTRGGASVTVTLARLPMDAAGYARWVTQSEDGYPQATLDVPAGEGNGFYECQDDAATRCNLLVQLRSGFHLEIRAEGSATRADVDAVARSLPMRALAAR
jgi:hypothetical protein